MIVTSLTYSNGVFTSTVQNQGTGPTPSGIVIGVGYFVDGAQQTWGSVMGPLAAGASMTIGTNGGNYVIPNGTHTIRAWADDVNRFPESNESNNDFSTSITIGAGALPDLILTSLSYSNGLFQCTAKNQGTAAVPQGTGIGVSYNVDGAWVTWGAYVDGVAPGASVTIGTWGDPYVIPSGTHTVQAIVDDVFTIAESNESNNTRTLTVSAKSSFVQNESAEGDGGSCGATGLEALLALVMAAICRAGGSCRRSRP